MNLRGKKLGILLGADPAVRNFTHGVALARQARLNGIQVYLYCIDAAVLGLHSPVLAELQKGGAKLFACAYSLQKRNLPLEGAATFAGLGVLHDLLTSTDRFVSFF
jgi:hypothetical protein